MPSLIRLIMVLGILVGGFYGAFYALGMFWEPEPRTMEKSLRPIKLK